MNTLLLLTYFCVMKLVNASQFVWKFYWVFLFLISFFEEHPNQEQNRIGRAHTLCGFFLLELYSEQGNFDAKNSTEMFKFPFKTFPKGVATSNRILLRYSHNILFTCSQVFFLQKSLTIKQSKLNFKENHFLVRFLRVNISVTSHDSVSPF
jgi:hypothetical protein